MKIKHFEFWNSHLFHLPVYLYWLFLAIKSRSLFFFCHANPGIESGGLIGESKSKILQKINPVYLPKTIFYPDAPDMNSVLRDLEGARITFPFIAKPDIGQGGWYVNMITDCHDLHLFLKRIKMPFMIQEYVDAPLEFGVLYYRYPGCERGYVTSLAYKELLHVIGDGKSTLKDLIEIDGRAKRFVEKIKRSRYRSLERIPEAGEKVALSFIGNHSYGTKFINMSAHITHELTYFFDCLSRSIPGFYFGRFDIKCHSIDDLKSGNFKILELNGVGSEPLHIFDPAGSLFKAYYDSLKHWKVIYEISSINRKNARYNGMKLRDAWQIYRHISKLQKMHAAPITFGN